MEEISVNGETYVKASVLAKNFGYTADYIGQLCRSGQVKATLVGRSWYVNEDSVREHRKGRYRSNSAKAKDHLRQTVEDRVIKTSSPTVYSSSPKSRYEPDESELFPSIKKPVEENIDSAVSEDEKKAQNKEEISLNTVPVRQERAIRTQRGPSPILRTIPRVAKNTPSPTILRPKSQVAPSTNVQVLTRRPSLVAAFALILGILAVESALLLGALGLEKRVLITADNQAMVLYAFDANQALMPIKEALSVR